MEAWLLFVIGIVLCIAELGVPMGFFLLILGVGALATGGLTYFGVIGSWGSQVAVFSVTSVALWFLFGDTLQRLLRSGEKAYGGLIGQTATARGVIAPGQKGGGEMWGAPWRLENIGDAPLNDGDECEVISSDGLVLQVKRKHS